MTMAWSRCFSGIHRVPTGLGRGVSTTVEKCQSSVQPQPEPKQKMSLAVKDYMERRRRYDEFIAQERSDFELGKRHLANMMGMIPEDMTQEDVDKAIEYLFPSGLKEPKARPLMKPPEEVFPLAQEAEFDAVGRPYNTFFYTAKPLYHQTMYDIVSNIEACYAIETRMMQQKIEPDADESLNESTLATSRWMTKEEVGDFLKEKISAVEHEKLVVGLKRLVQLPFSYKLKDFIMQFRKGVGEITNLEHDLSVEIDEHGREYVEAIGQRKSSLAKVRVTKPGTGKFSLVHIDYPDHPQDITYFYGLSQRYQILYPLQFTDLTESVDVDVIVDAGGSSGQAGAIRYALASCLRSFVDDDVEKKMLISGLLTQNIQVRERKKPGRPGARKKFLFRKR